MGSVEEEEEFFDSRDEISSVSDTDESLFEVWMSSPDSIRTRRARFMRSMGLGTSPEAVGQDVSRIMSNDEASSTTCSTNCHCESDESFKFGGSTSADSSNRSSFVEDDVSYGEGKMRRRLSWLRRLGGLACVVDRQEEEIDEGSCRSRRVKVHRCKKNTKEFSALYVEQDIIAHDGAILTMKFSRDGEFLASGGEDGVVRVWRVTEYDGRDQDGILEYDPSCMYFKVNHDSILSPLFVADKEKVKYRSMTRTSNLACVVIPPQVFRISETPVHEFFGHEGDVLDLSWSSDKYLLSSSVDKTVRLWKVGCNNCLQVFVHNNYVTCVQFNPVNENYFVSGSIDGKLRIWELSSFRVAVWTHTKDIITTVCYHPDGKGIVVGTMTGDCRFYNASDNVLELEVRISLQGKKKSPEKRITGFQYCPSNPRKLMVTSADSVARILDGVDIVSKYKGFRNAGTRISASFTSDGRHIISASEDSTVCVWTHDTTDTSISPCIRTIKSYEQFVSAHVSVAIPWQSQGTRNIKDICTDSWTNDTLYLSPAGSIKTLSNELNVAKGSTMWPEEKLPAISTLRKSQYKFLKSSCRNSSHAWGQVIVTGGWDGKIRTYQNHGLPINS